MDDRTPTSYAEVAREVLRRPPRWGPVRLVAVDGPSGAGKTGFAGRLAAALRGAGASVETVHTDDLLDGWEDQFTFWRRLREQVLAPLRDGIEGGYHPYDWVACRFSERYVAVPPADVVILEGVSTARASIRPGLTLAVFLTVPADLALTRVLARDGAALRPYLLRWQRRERSHFAADATAAHADLVVDGDPTGALDPARQFARVDAGADLGDDRASR